jgi:hypothetical protein
MVIDAMQTTAGSAKIGADAMIPMGKIGKCTSYPIVTILMNLP